MKGKLVNKYNRISKSTGNVVRTYVYEVTSFTPDELAEYQLTQGINYRESEESGNPLYFTSTFEGNYVDIVKAKSKDRTTGLMTDVYRPISSEDFELKRSMLTAANRQATTPVVTAKPAAAAKIDVNDAEF